MKRHHAAAHNGIPKDDEETLKDGIDLCMISNKTWQLLKGVELCIQSAAIYIVIDFQRVCLPHFVRPPELKDDDDTKTLKRETNSWHHQD